MSTALRLTVRAALLAVLWWALADGSLYNWQVGAVVVVLTTAATWRLLPPRAARGGLVRRAWAVVTLAGWFLARSVVGGADVARRALTRPPDTDPDYVEHRFRLPDGPARVAVTYLNNLMPGSLSVQVDGDVLLVHTIAHELPTLEQVAELEERVARVAGHTLDPGGEG